jgi:hypothetical protein
VPPNTGSVPAPNQNGYGYGPCWAR